MLGTWIGELGYQVDMGAADDFVLPAAAAVAANAVWLALV